MLIPNTLCAVTDMLMHIHRLIKSDEIKKVNIYILKYIYYDIHVHEPHQQIRCFYQLSVKYVWYVGII